LFGVVVGALYGIELYKVSLNSTTPPIRLSVPVSGFASTALNHVYLKPVPVTVKLSARNYCPLSFSAHRKLFYLGG
jgi:hypothetical protein